MTSSLPESEHTPGKGERGLLSEDHEPIKLVDDATRSAWEPKPPKRTKAQRQAIIAEARKRRGEDKADE